MKPRSIFIIVMVAVAMATLFYTLQGPGTSEEYIKEIEKERAEKDDFMRSSDESPFADSIDLFTGLKYFAPDEKYRVSANLTMIEERKAVTLSTSDGLERRFIEYAYANFSLDGEDCRLLLLEVMDMGPMRGTLFLAFADATSAEETYGAGRYLDLKKVPGGTSMVLDFNKAYNPYCAYNDRFSCPLPLAENLLKVAIKAGEKVYYK
jgi:uncharacterized protein